MAMMVWPLYLPFGRWKTPKYGSTRGFYSFWEGEGRNEPSDRKDVSSMPDDKLAFAKVLNSFWKIKEKCGKVCKKSVNRID